MARTPRQPAEAQPPRMGALAKLPVFLDLAGKRAVMAGGTAPAAWKAELLAAAGADVHIYAIYLGPEMVALLERGAAAGRLRHHLRPWALDCFVGAAIALADAETEAEAQAFFCAARAAGVPVNVIDKPAYCQFQFGSIVNRSPVVIGISTDGGAPILGQAIRRRIETLLPASLAAWGQRAKDIRALVSSRLGPGPQRRMFWEAFAERAFGPVTPSGVDAQLTTLVEETRTGTSSDHGRVTLVGAGPGDADLLTLKAVRALQSADIILFDDLVSDGVLELARREAKRMMVGKRGGRDSCSQDDINALMLKLAKQGKHVVRLKCGDPMIFGRAGEEIAMLKAHDITVSVVPGITAASAMAARLGLSLTHRDHAQSVRFVTGHARSGSLPDDLDWKGLADPNTTLIFYMASNTAPLISDRLMAAGLAPETPAHIVAGVTHADEEHWSGSVQDLADGLATIDRRLPVLIGVGCALATVAEARQDQIVLDPARTAADSH
jgi:uroporphyrin-III C-methyltransferase / precorrin-2 dehydrogenase / sirohydrochlorin ferrochelatase